MEFFAVICVYTVLSKKYIVYVSMFDYVTCSLLYSDHGKSPNVNISHNTTAKLHTSESIVNIPLLKDSGASHLIGNISFDSMTHSFVVSSRIFDRPKSLIFTLKLSTESI